MKEKPLLFNILGHIFLAIALSFPLQVAYFEGHHLFYESQIIFSKLSPLNLITIVVLLSTALMSYLGHQSLRYLVPLSVFCVVINNLQVATFGHLDIMETTLASASFTLISSTLFLSRSHRAIFSPDLRWWRVSKRYDLPLRVELNSAQSDHENAPLDLLNQAKLQTFDISRSGIFVPLDKNSPEKIKQHLENLPEELNIKLIDEKKQLYRCGKRKIFTRDIFNLKVKVVRHSRTKKGLYPAGVGFQIIGGNILHRLAWNYMLADYNAQR